MKGVFSSSSVYSVSSAPSSLSSHSSASVEHFTSLNGLGVNFLNLNNFCIMLFMDNLSEVSGWYDGGLGVV